MRVFETLQDLAACVGQEVAVSDWIAVTQEQVNQFAEATGDPQWIHVDVERAKSGPFGGTIAHGFLTLSMLPKFFESSFEIRQTRMGGAGGFTLARAHDAEGSGMDRARRPADDLVGHRGARGPRQAGLCGRVAEPTLSLSRCA